MAATELSDGAAATERIGAELAARLAPGDVVLIGGELGSGKTTLVRGICRALGVNEPVTSPTYTIGQVYRSSRPRLMVCHLDLYRLGDMAGEEPGLLDDYLGADRITLIEWPAAAESELSGTGRVRARVRIEHRSPSERDLRIEIRV